MAKQHTVKLPLAKETKNMLQYQAPKDSTGDHNVPDKADAIIPTLYVSKKLFKAPDWPAYLKITVEGLDK